MPADPTELARELAAAYAARRIIPVPPSARDAGLDLPAAYAVESALVRLKLDQGSRPVGRKVGFANRALWRKFKLDTVLWAHMYDDTVRYASRGVASLSLGAMIAPKIEPEIIFKLKRPLRGDADDSLEALRAVEWMALGFEIVDCVFQDWKFLPVDFVAAFGLHAGLIVGTPLSIAPAMIPGLAERLPQARARLLKNGTLIAEGSGANVLESPARSLGELAAGLARQPEVDPLAAGEIIATGALTDNQFISPGETWSAAIDDLDLPALTLHCTA